jgi:peptidoglycan/LPS O-acetylase OafA/YrhL
MPGRPEPFKLGYRPALDGLRAVAVLAVMLYHSGLIQGGFLGVDVFFTLSGFLITTLLLEEYARAGTIAIGRFYARRALRLLPALVAFLLVWGLVFLATRPPRLWPVILGDLLGVLFYVTNWLIGYYGRGGSSFSHTWSLSIEEQFYMVWPVTLLLLLRWARHASWIVVILLTAAAGSLVWRLALAMAGTQITRIFVVTHAHADGILIGAALAVLLSRQGALAATGPLRRAPVALSVLGLPLLFLAAPAVPGYVYGVTALAALASGGVILDIVAGGSRVTRWLEWAWLGRIGQISYGLYLWHFPVFQQLGVLPQPGGSAAPFWRSALAWSLSFAAALISYVVIERPFLAYKARLRATPEIERAPAALVPPPRRTAGSRCPRASQQAHRPR